MSLAPGTRLGPYEILSPLGAGGMGEVYRARDSRLGRSVAIKVLPTSFAQDAERLRRFEQEAQAAGGLNHPNITAVYELGAHEGAPYIVTELLEGETLRARLSGGALPIRKATDYAIQMAKGLAAAHEKGIVHRDLKPDNLFVTNDGRIKILDFGLAKLTQRDDGAGGQTNLPTVTGTEPGVVLGTLGYMAPEQVKGKPADARSDIFAFGAILYEMLSGSRAFHRDSAAETMSAILREEPPDLSATNKSVQPGLERIIRHCLEKNPEERFHSAHDLAFDLEALSGISGTAVAAAPSRVSRVRPLPLVAAVLALAALAAAAWLGLSRGRSAPAASPRVLRTNVLLPENLTLNNAVISPDGSRIVFGGTDASGNVQLWVRPLDSYTSTPLAGTDGGVLPFWSPDARFIGFFADKKMKRIEASGGAPIVLAEVDGLGGAWAPNGDIFFTGPSGPIQRLPAAGGKPEPVTKLDASRGETAHRYPYFLPDGRHFLYLAINLAGPRNDPANRIWVGSVDGAPSKPLIPSNFNAQYSDGYLLFIRGGDFGGSLLAQPFDVDRLETSGQPITVAEQVGLYGDFLALGNYTVSGARTLVYDASQLSTRLEWLDRNGKQMGTFGEPAAHFGLRLSPDGSRVAVGVYDPRSQTTQLWVGDVARGVRTRLTSGPGSNSNPVWSPDGSRIAFQTDRKHQADMYVMPAAGSGAEEAITDEEGQRLPQDWSKDGRYIVYVDREAAGSRLQQVLVMPMTGERKPLTLLPRSANDFGFSMRLSPDGRWVTYDVDESGRREVYVVSFPEGQSKVQISSSGGQNPKWGRGGKEIVYSSFDGKVLSVDVDGSRGLRVGTPRPLFQLPERTFGWDVTADGERFLINVPVIKSSSIPLSVVVNWSAGLKN